MGGLRDEKTAELSRQYRLKNLIFYEFPILLHQVAIKILAGKSDFLCSTRNGGDLMVKVFFPKINLSF